MKRVYIEPKTDVASMAMAMTICHVSVDGKVSVNNTDPIEGIKIE